MNSIKIRLVESKTTKHEEAKTLMLCSFVLGLTAAFALFNFLILMMLVFA